MSRIRAFLEGKLPLAQSMFVFIVAPRGVIWLGLWLVGFWPYPWIWALLPFLVADLVVFLLQLTGFNRATETHLRSHGSMSAVWGGYLALLFIAGFTFTLWWGVILAALTPPELESYADQEERLRRETYSLTVAENGRDLVFSGEITFGLTKRIRALLDETPSIETLVLTSPGGHIYEARGVAGLILKAGLGTQVVSDCSSACTLIFIAGTPRALSPDARLGFHQYAVLFGNTLPSVDIAREQAKDMEFFRNQGVSPVFLSRMYEQSSDGLWYPPNDLLISAGVISAP